MIYVVAMFFGLVIGGIADGHINKGGAAKTEQSN